MLLCAAELADASCISLRASSQLSAPLTPSCKSTQRNYQGISGSSESGQRVVSFCVNQDNGIMENSHVYNPAPIFYLSDYLHFGRPSVLALHIKMSSSTDNRDDLVISSDPEHPANLICELCRDFYKLGWVTGTGGGKLNLHYTLG